MAEGMEAEGAGRQEQGQDKRQQGIPQKQDIRPGQDTGHEHNIRPGQDTGHEHNIRPGQDIEPKQDTGSGQEEGTEPCCVHRKFTPRAEGELKQLKNRLSRMAGQLNGIGKMLDENRYCGDILMQVAAVESALQSFGYLILQEHMETCVAEEVRKGNAAVLDEVVELVKKLK